MEETEEGTKMNPVRKTRSGRAVRTPATAAAKAKAAPKGGPRKTRKKVVMVEVEVTDEEDNAVTNTDEEINKDNLEEEDKNQEKDTDSNLTINNEDSLLNSSTDSDIKRNGSQKDDVSASLVLNDIEMLEEIQPNEKAEETPVEKEVLQINEPMEVDSELDTSETSETVVSTEKIDKPDIPKTEEEIKEIPNEKIITKIAAEPESDSEELSKDAVVNDKAAKEVAEAKIEESNTEAIQEIVDKCEKVESESSNDTGATNVDNETSEKMEEESIEEAKETATDVTEKIEEKTEKMEETPTDDTEDKKKSVEVKPVASDDKEPAGKEDIEEAKEKEDEEVAKEKEDKEVAEEKEDKEEAKEDKEPAKKDDKGESKEDKAPAEKKDKEPSKDDKEAASDVKEIAQNGDPDAENISEDELPGVPVAKVPETEEVSDEELPGPKRAELPADTEVVSEDELPTVKKESEDELPKKEGTKRKLSEGDYDPDSPTSENETPCKKPALDTSDKEKEKEEKPVKPKKLPELDKYWKAVNDDPTDFTGWTYLLQYVDQENDMEAAREAYDAFLSHYPYCYGYWRKYADYEKRKGNKKKCEEVFERGLKAIPLSVDLWIHYLTYVKSTKPDDEEYIRSQFERALAACGLEFRSDRLWDSYIKWETEGKRLQKVTALYDRLLATPTQGYTSHFDNFQEHISSNSPNKVIEVDEFLALRKEVRNMLKQDAATENPAENADIPPGDEEVRISTDEETKCIKERIVSIRRKTHKNTVNAVTARWNYEEGIKRPYFHVKPLERCQLKNWQDYLEYEIEQGDKVRIIVLFERCLIACALYEEFWLKFVHFLENLKDEELLPKIRDVYERACTIHHLKKPNLHLQWAMFEESVDNTNRAAEILVNLEKSVPNVLQVAYRRINLERRRGDFEKCSQLFEHYINNSKNKMISSNIAIKYSRFCLKVVKDIEKAQEVLKLAITKDPNNPRLYLQLIDLTLQKENVTEDEICALIEEFLEKESADPDQKVLFAQRKLEYLEDFGSSIKAVQTACEQYQKYIKLSKENLKKKEPKSEPSSSSKKEKPPPPSSSQPGSYNNYNYTSSSQPSYPYSGSNQGQYGYSGYQTGDQYQQYQNWQYPQGGYGGYNQWGGYGGGYGY